MNIVDTILCESDPTRVVYHWNQQHITTAVLRDRIYARARDLKTRGIDTGDLVAIKAPDSMSWIYTFWALTLLGTKILLLPELMDAMTTRELMIKHGIKHCITHEIDPAISDVSIDMHSFQDRDPSPMLAHDYHDQESYLHWMSSGTNGVTKIVVHSQTSIKNSMLGLAQFHDMCGSVRGDRWFCGAKFSFSLGCFMNVLGPALLDHCAELGITLNELRDFPAVVDRRDIHHAVVTPHVLNMIMKSSPTSGLTSLRSMTSGAESLPYSLAQAWQQKFSMPVQNLYGLSELFIVSADKTSAIKNSLGTVLPVVSVRIVDDQGHDTAPGTPGVIRIKTPCQFMGYLDDPESTQEVVIDGWIHTNDVGFFDDNHNLIFLGRANTCVKSRGRWISMSDIENSILEQSDVEDCVVLPTENAQGSLELMALVVPRSPALDINNLLKPHQTHHVTTQVRAVPTIPRTANMKKIRNLDIIKQRLSLT